MGRKIDQRGFTLIEIIMVILLIAILMATAVPEYIDMKDAAAKATAKGILASLAGADNILFANSILKGGAYDETSVVVNANMSGGATAMIAGSAGTITVPGYSTGFTFAYTPHNSSSPGIYTPNW